MRICRQWLVLALLAGCLLPPEDRMRRNHRAAVQTELAASRDDQSHWLYYEVPSASVTQWVAETSYGQPAARAPAERHLPLSARTAPPH